MVMTKEEARRLAEDEAAAKVEVENEVPDTQAFVVVDVPPKNQDLADMCQAYSSLGFGLVVALPNGTNGGRFVWVGTQRGVDQMQAIHAAKVRQSQIVEAGGANVNGRVKGVATIRNMDGAVRLDCPLCHVSGYHSENPDGQTTATCVCGHHWTWDSHEKKEE